ncbi:MAG: cupredoxin domain-containing protein [Nitrososphaeraceae archaeon]
MFMMVANLATDKISIEVLGQQAADNNINNNTSLGTVGVSIVPGAAALGDKAYSPNPIDIKIGDTIVWTNDDTSDTPFHTVTSGSRPDDENNGQEFDSGLTGATALMTKGTTFTHTFDAAGEFPYFCQLHPTMIGKVVVTS